MATSCGFEINLVNSDGSIASNTGNNTGTGITDAMLCSNSTWAVPYDSSTGIPIYNKTPVYDSNGNYDSSLYNANTLNTSSYNGIALPSTGDAGINLPNGSDNVIGFFFPWYLFTNVFSGQTITLLNQSNVSVNIFVYIPPNISDAEPSLYGCAVQQPENDNYYNSSGSGGPNNGYYLTLSGQSSGNPPSGGTIEYYTSSSAGYWLQSNGGYQFS